MIREVLWTVKALVFVIILAALFTWALRESLVSLYPVAAGVVYFGGASIMAGVVFRVFYGRWPHLSAPGFVARPAGVVGSTVWKRIGPTITRALRRAAGENPP